MSTILEIQYPELTYCKKYELYCPCHHCDGNHFTCIKKNYPTNFCNHCLGPTELSKLSKLSKRYMTNIFAFINTKETKESKGTIRCPSKSYILNKHINPLDPLNPLVLVPEPIYIPRYPAKFIKEDKKDNQGRKKRKRR